MARLNTNALLKRTLVWNTGATQDFSLDLEDGLYVFGVGKEINGTLRATAVNLYVSGNDGGGSTMIPISTGSGKYIKLYAVSYVQDGINYKGARYEYYENSTIVSFGNANVYSVYKIL